MPDDTLQRLRTRLPALFTTALSRLERRAQGGDTLSARRLHEVGEDKVPALLRLRGEGGGELWLLAARSGLSLCEDSPVDAEGAASRADRFGHALELPVSVARYALAQAERGGVAVEHDVDDAVLALASIASQAARSALAQGAFQFAFEVLNVPVLGSVRAQVGFGRPVLGSRPEFSLHVESDELEDAREEGVSAQQLFLSGKIRIDGDVARAMQLAMVLAQLR